MRCSSIVGFAATTIAAIAEAADVSVPTVYAGFTSKAELLRRAIEVAFAGDDEPVVVADRPTSSWVHEADTAEELGRAIYAVMMGELASRAGQIYGVLVAAADAEPELAELLRTFEAQRLRAATLIAEAIDRAPRAATWAHRGRGPRSHLALQRA